MRIPLWLQRLLNGRPMIVVQPSFVDKVSGKTVFRCIDLFGRLWQANGRWSFFRLRVGADWEAECARREFEKERRGLEASGF